eukprot:572274_1
MKLCEKCQRPFPKIVCCHPRESGTPVVYCTEECRQKDFESHKHCCLADNPGRCPNVSDSVPTLVSQKSSVSENESSLVSESKCAPDMMSQEEQECKLVSQDQVECKS